MVPDFAATVAWLAQRRPDLKFIAAMASPATRVHFEAALDAAGAREQVTLFDGVVARGDGRERRDFARVRHRYAGGDAREAADGRRVSASAR